MRLFSAFLSALAALLFAGMAHAEDIRTNSACNAVNDIADIFEVNGGFKCGGNTNNMNHRMNQASALAGAMDFNASDNNDWTINLNFVNADFNSAASAGGLNLTYKLPAASDTDPLWGVFTYATVGAGFSSLMDGDDTMSALQVTFGW